MNSLQLREIRKKLDLTQEEFADKLGISSRTYIKYENDSPIPKSKIELINLILEKHEQSAGDDYSNLQVTDAFELAEFENNNANLFSAIPLN